MVEKGNPPCWPPEKSQEICHYKYTVNHLTESKSSKRGVIDTYATYMRTQIIYLSYCHKCTLHHILGANYPKITPITFYKRPNYEKF